MKTEKDEELYSVAMIFKKSVSIAYGKVEDREDMYKGWALTMNLVVPIPDELRFKTTTT